MSESDVTDERLAVALHEANIAGVDDYPSWVAYARDILRVVSALAARNVVLASAASDGALREHEALVTIFGECHHEVGAPDCVTLRAALAATEEPATLVCTCAGPTSDGGHRAFCALRHEEPATSPADFRAAVERDIAAMRAQPAPALDAVNALPQKRSGSDVVYVRLDAVRAIIAATQPVTAALDPGHDGPPFCVYCKRPYAQPAPALDVEHPCRVYGCLVDREALAASQPVTDE